MASVSAAAVQCLEIREMTTAVFLVVKGDGSVCFSCKKKKTIERVRKLGRKKNDRKQYEHIQMKNI